MGTWIETFLLSILRVSAPVPFAAILIGAGVALIISYAAFVGKNPKAAESAGVSVVKVQFLAYALSGALFAALLFGTAGAAVSALQTTNVITDFVRIIPYAVTIISPAIISVSTERKARSRS